MDKQIWHLMSMYDIYIDRWSESDPPQNTTICIIATVNFWKKRPDYIMYDEVKYFGKNKNGNYILLNKLGNEIEDDIIRIICWGYRI